MPVDVAGFSQRILVNGSFHMLFISSLVRLVSGIIIIIGEERNEFFPLYENAVYKSA